MISGYEAKMESCLIYGPFKVMPPASKTLPSTWRVGAHYLEPPSPILTLGVNPFPYIFIFRTDLLRFVPGVFPLPHQLLHSDPLLLRIKRCDLQNNNGDREACRRICAACSAPQEQCFRWKHVSKNKKDTGRG